MVKKIHLPLKASECGMVLSCTHLIILYHNEMDWDFGAEN
jgi:hypothetical protein